MLGGCCGCSKEFAGSDSDDDSIEKEMMEWLEQMQLKRSHPDRLHPDLWYNEQGQV